MAECTYDIRRWSVDYNDALQVTVRRNSLSERLRAVSWLLFSNWNHHTPMQRIRRIRCCWRYAHRMSPTIGWFRYDVGGWCSDCRKVGNGINHNDDGAVA